MVLLDVKNAFDRLPHAAVIEALLALVVCGNLLSFVRAFLQDRTYRVRLNGVYSAPRPVNCGVPQGSVLSPFLFNLELAYLPFCIPTDLAFDVHVIIYADDMAFFVAALSRVGEKARRTLETALDAVTHFERTIGLEPSPTKTEAILFHRNPSHRRNYYRPLLLEATRLPGIKAVKYLGVHIDATLSWSTEISKLPRESKRVANLTLRLPTKDKGCSPDLCIRLYEGLATSEALYALPFARLSKKVLEALRD